MIAKHAAVYWTTPGRTLFGGWAVFAGDFFDLDAAAAVADAPFVAARLVEKSLIAATEDTDGRMRYRLLETVREYALELLVEAGEGRRSGTLLPSATSSLTDIAREEWLRTERSRITQ